MAKKKPLPKGPKGDLNVDGVKTGAREQAEEMAVAAWTEILKEFKSNPESAIGKIEHETGRAIRDLLQTWSLRRNLPERKELAVALGCLYRSQPAPTDLGELSQNSIEELSYVSEDNAGKSKRAKKQSVVLNLSDKLSGRFALTLRDAIWIVAAIVAYWPNDRFSQFQSDGTVNTQEAFKYAFAFVQNLVIQKTPGMLEGEKKRLFELDYDFEKLKPPKGGPYARWIFLLSQDQDAPSLISSASEKRGAWIVASSESIFIESDPVASIKNFGHFADIFSSKPTKENGILIFVIDGGVLKSSKREIYTAEKSRRILFNWHMLIAAISSYAIFGTKDHIDQNASSHRRNFDRWNNFKNRCCVVLKDFSLLNPSSFSLATYSEFDQMVRHACNLKETDFPTVSPSSGPSSTERQFVLPMALPSWADGARALPKSGFTEDVYHHWNVKVHDEAGSPKEDVTYYVVPRQKVAVPNQNDSSGGDQTDSQVYISGGFAYLKKCDKHKAPSLIEQYDYAQRLIYKAARGRLCRDEENAGLDAAYTDAIAELRSLYFEVLPIDIALKMMTSLVDPTTNSSDIKD